jgi:hypothetical protein
MGDVEVADVFRQYGPAYRQTRKLPVNQLRTMHAIEICRTPELGGHVDQCDCGHTRISYNSCRNRHCPKCQFLRKEKWIEARQRDLLPIPYFHVVFTIPDSLNPLALRNQEIIYGILFKATKETLLELGKRLKEDRLYLHPPYLGPEPHGSSPYPLHRHRRRVIRHQMGLITKEVLSSRKGYVAAV